jgi:hypothetical protein
MSKVPVKLKAKIEKRWVLSVGGTEIPMRFIKSKEMAGMVLLTSEEVGNQLVVDVPDHFESILNDVLETGKDFEVTVVKASGAVAEAVKEAYAEVARLAEEREEDLSDGSPEPTDEPAETVGTGGSAEPVQVVDTNEDKGEIKHE